MGHRLWDTGRTEHPPTGPVPDLPCSWAHTACVAVTHGTVRGGCLPRASLAPLSTQGGGADHGRPAAGCEQRQVGHLGEGGAPFC